MTWRTEATLTSTRHGKEIFDVLFVRQRREYEVQRVRMDR